MFKRFPIGQFLQATSTILILSHNSKIFPNHDKTLNSCMGILHCKLDSENVPGFAERRIVAYFHGCGLFNWLFNLDRVIENFSGAWPPQTCLWLLPFYFPYACFDLNFVIYDQSYDSEKLIVLYAKVLL